MGANTISGCDLAAHVAALQLTSFQRSRATALGVIHLVRTIGVRRKEPGAVAPTLDLKMMTSCAVAVQKHMSMHCCYSDVIICTYMVSGWVRNLELYANVLNGWPIRL